MLSQALSALDGKAVLTADDSITVRRIVFGGDCTVSRDEAEALMTLNADAGEVSPEWRMLFIEALTDYIVHQQQPEGYVDAAKAEWLAGVVRREAHVREDEVEMLVHVLEKADQTPEGFSTFVLELIKSLILERFQRSRDFAADDIERLRRALFAAGGEMNVAISRHEAEILFDINDVVGATTSDPAWANLFVRAVSNAVLFETPWRPDAKAELKREAWLEDTSVHPFSRLAHMFRSKSDDHLMEKTVAADEALEVNAERLTAEEAHWLVERIGRNGRVDANERALIAFIRANAREIDTALDEVESRPDAPSERASPILEPSIFDR